jgi:trigger factor
MFALPMQVTVQRISPVLVELSIEVPADAVKTEVDKAYVNLARKAHVRGFRPGKAPRSVLSHLYGPQVHNDVAKAIVDTTLPQVLTEKQVTPVTRPTVETGTVSATEAFSYKARFEVQPDIEEVKYDGFQLYRPKVEATDAMVDEQIESLRLRHATLKAPEPARPSQNKDVVTIDFTVSVDGHLVKDAGGQGVQIELGAGQALPELDVALVGRSTGDSAECEVTFSEGHPNAVLKGKKGTFQVTVTDLKERILPALDDELAKDVGQFQTLIELRADVHTRLERALHDQSESALAQQMVTKLNEANPLELPPSLVEQQCRVLEQELTEQARRAGQRVTAEHLKTMHGAIHADAEQKVRAGLLMAAIARKNEIKVTDEDIEKAYVELAEQSGKNVAKVKAEYRENSRKNILLSMILEDKILDFIEAKSTITEGTPPPAAPPSAATEEPKVASAAAESPAAAEAAESGEEEGDKKDAAKPKKKKKAKAEEG